MDNELKKQMDEESRYPYGKRGFASMDPDKQRDIARKGGVAVHVRGTGHKWDSEEAREAGRKGGMAAQAKRKTP